MSNEDLTALSKEISNFPKPMIRIEAFKQIYLPLLFNPNPSLFNFRWINEVSMNPYLSVNILDTDNNIIHVVPPLRTPIDSTKLTRLNDVTNLAIAEQSVHKARGEIFLADTLPKMMQFKEARSEELKRQWDIFITELGFGDMIVNRVNINGIKETNKEMIGNIDLEDDNKDW
jgi:hypothetical protein